MIFSSLSAQETYRMYGKITRAQTEELIDQSSSLGGLVGIDAHISEALGQFPAEDFLESTKTRLHELSKRLRGDNKTELLAILEAMDDLAQCTFNAADYGRSELNQAIKALEKANEVFQ